MNAENPYYSDIRVEPSKEVKEAQDKLVELSRDVFKTFNRLMELIVAQEDQRRKTIKLMERDTPTVYVTRRPWWMEAAHE